MRTRDLIINGVFIMWTPAILIASAALADEAKPPEARGWYLLTKKLASLHGGRVSSVTEEYVSRAFPDHLFYVLGFAQYPLARSAPAPLHVRNLFIVRPTDFVEHIVDRGALETFFRSTLAPVTTEAQAVDAAKAWMRLLEEFHQDGYYRFSIPEESVVAAATSGGQEVTVKAVVDAGGWGEIVTHLTFDHVGRLVNITDAASLKRSIRPVCQATKLLDADPLVREMAEQAILVIGKSAKEYLDEQRARARPELQQAIDRVWQRILDEDR